MVHLIRRIKSAIANDSNSLSDICIRAALWCASQPYAAAIWMRNRAFDQGLKKTTRVAAPVISVGNLTAGGTGKTPTVAYLAKWFREREYRIAILSRGYGAGPDGRNDEAKELEAILPDVPHLQSPDRVSIANVAIEELEMQALILDDGFQHRKIARDLEIVLLDAREPFGFGHLLPRGLLREPPRSLKRADIVIATRADQVDAQKLATIRSKVQRYNPKAAWLESVHYPTRLRNAEGETEDIGWLRGKTVTVVCSIGNPAAFLDTVQSTGAATSAKIIFPDHHLFHSGDMQEIATKATAASCDAILCTGKDLAKIDVPQLNGIPIWSIDIELRISNGEEALTDHLEEIARQINYPQSH